MDDQRPHLPQVLEVRRCSVGGASLRDRFLGRSVVGDWGWEDDAEIIEVFGLENVMNIYIYIPYIYI